MSIHAPYFVSAAVAALCTPTSAAQAAPSARLTFNLEQQPLEEALLTISRVSGRQIIFASDSVSGKRAPRLHGRYTAEEAAQRAVKAAGLAIRTQGTAILVVAAVGVTEPDATDVVVTGSRIRGAQAYAPVTSASREALRSQGQTDLGEALRTLPQNFGGGQSPYVGIGAEDFGSDNLNSGSSINLRGLGADATLTLLNGRRLAYDGVGEGVDVSAIPLAAIDRVEIVADGASAIYGSDAVAGVANVILRRDVSGLETSARFGAATDGGDVQEQLDVVAGTTWRDGGIVATLSYAHNSDVTADQRSFSRQLDRTTTIVPRIDQFSAVASAHQAVGPHVEAQLDLLYTRRTSYLTYPNAPDSSYLESGVDRHLDATSVTASPSVRIELGSRWSATVSGNYARDRLNGRQRYFVSGTTAIDGTTIYTNESAGGEGSVEGVLATLPGGEARLAAGLGYRWVGLNSDRSTVGAGSTIFTVDRDSYYGFGEFNLPLVGPENSRPGVHRLSANIAGRYEHYPQIDNVFTPKLSLLYAPTKFLELRGTWGRSFKAPTLYQLYAAQGTLLFPASFLGGAGYPSSATAVYVYGGNEDLKPQRATSWSAGAVLNPFADRRLTLDVTYFRTRYRDRIANPFTSAVTALNDPLVTGLVTFDPSEASVDDLIASTGVALVNYVGQPYDPSNVVAIVDNRSRNIAVQTIEGVDASATWRLDLAGGRVISLSASGTYLTSQRRLSADQPLVALAGTIFNPPHFRGRVGASLNDGPLLASVFSTVVGGVEDRRYDPLDHIDGQTSVDLALGYSFPATEGVLRGLKLQLSVLNVFDDLPERVRTGDPTYTPFDAANYNPVGRLLSLTVVRKW